MPIVNATIKASIDLLIDQTKILEPTASKEAFSQGLANLIETTLKSTTVTIPSGAIVTTGSATTQTNATPAIGTLS